jgi:sulfoxide reductase heme-binding subunit YedZ
MSSSTQVGPHIFWILSRAAGTTALVLSSISVCVGLLMAGRMKTGGASERRAYHEILSLSVLVAIAVHGLVLVGDGFVHPSILDVTLPFAWSYMRLATTLGILAGWALILLGMSFYLRDRIGRNRWKLIHRFTILAWLAGLVHTIIEGTDVGTLWYAALLVVTTAPVLLLLATRISRAPQDFGLVERVEPDRRPRPQARPPHERRPLQLAPEPQPSARPRSLWAGEDPM